MGVRVNMGCGQTPTDGWRNFDNSLSVRLGKFPLWSVRLLSPLLGLRQKTLVNIEFYQQNNVYWANSAKRIPLGNGEVEVLYSSHMFEHLSRRNARKFLGEALRVLQSDGILRLALPDLSKLVSKYIEDGDADAFMEGLWVVPRHVESFKDRLFFILFGFGDHQWMYDSSSIVKLLQELGFVDVKILPPNKTTIPDYLPLNLTEREDESLYVEAKAP